MRIIAGRLGSRQFDSPKGHRTHPMGDRVRTALFNTLGDIEGLTVLDAFGGSGALSFEALSRGATHATILEIDRPAYQTIQGNANILDLTRQITPFNINARSWSIKNPDQKFDLILCDPPYDQLQETTLERLANHLKPDGVIIYSLPPHADLRLASRGFELISSKSYGDATLQFYSTTPGT